MRGEYPIFRKRKVSPQGSPPHAWGIPTADLKAGKSLGSPPHAWGIPVLQIDPLTRKGITPTCVGNT